MSQQSPLRRVHPVSGVCGGRGEAEAVLPGGRRGTIMGEKETQPVLASQMGLAIEEEDEEEGDPHPQKRSAASSSESNGPSGRG